MFYNFQISCVKVNGNNTLQEEIKERLVNGNLKHIMLILQRMWVDGACLLVNYTKHEAETWKFNKNSNRNLCR